MAAFPSSPADLTPEWVSEVLHRNGSLTTSQVTAIAVRTIGSEVGFLDRVARVELTFDRPEATAPRSLILKVSTSEALYQRIANAYDAYEREFHFYETVAPSSPIRLPRCFGREADPVTNAHWLFLEDLSALSAGDQVRGMTPAQARATMETVGRFHAAWWDTPHLKSLAWMPGRNINPSRYRAAWPSFRKDFGPLLPLAAMELGDHLNENLESLLAEIEKPPHTIVHSDFRADNLLFDPSSSQHPVVILDWQLAIRSRGILDVARLMCGSLAPQDRSTSERESLRLWHETLVLHGVTGYSFEQALADYRRAALIGLYYPVTVHTAEEAAGERGTALAHAQIERFFTAAVELNSPLRA